MKKTYSKPEIVFESFSLSQNIAAGCEVKTNTPSQSECGIDFGGSMLFVDGMNGMNGCKDIAVDNVGGDGVYNGICYHVPTGENLFNS